MKKSRQTKRALIPSILAVIMCVAMLIGTTFAWFTDTASTSVNKIQAGKLDVELVKPTANEGGTYDALGTAPLKWVKSDSAPTTEEVLWEPGATYNLESFRIQNNGNLALKYQVQISGIVGNAELLQAIDFTVKLGDGAATTLANWDGTLEAGGTSDIITITGTMKADAGNEYQGKSIDGIAITVVATQAASEYDSEDNQYDADAVLPVSGSAKGNLTVTTTTTEGTTPTKTVKVDKEQVLSDSVMTVTYPADVVLNVTANTDGTATVDQKLEYVGTTARGSGVTISEDTQAVASYDLELPVATTNTTLVTVTIKYTAGLSQVKIYHDSSTALPMSSSDDGSEYAEYDKTSGVITLHLKHASPIDIVYGKPGVTSATGATLNNVFGGTDFDFGYNNNSTEAITLDGKGTAVVTDWVDAYLSSDTTIKGVTFMNGATFATKSNNIKVTFENCTFYACDQSKLIYTHNNSMTNSGAGMCLNLEKSATTGAKFVVKNCTFIGENDPNLPVYGNKYNGDGSVADAYKKRGHAIALDAICGGGTGTLNSLLIENCTIDGVRGNAIQLYGTTGDITIKDTKINSWGVNSGGYSYVDKDGKTQNKDGNSYAIRGDFNTAGSRTIRIENVYFGLAESETTTDHQIGHIFVGSFPGNTVTDDSVGEARAAGTYSYLSTTN